MANPGLPQNAISSMSQYFQGLSGLSKEEKGLLVRMGTLIDAIVESERGLGNAGGVTRRKVDAHQPTLNSTARNVVNAIHVEVEEPSTRNLSHYEIQCDTNVNFSAPTSIENFTAQAEIKGLTAGETYYVRVRPVNKAGDVGLWSATDAVTVTTAFSEVDGTQLGEDAESKTFTFASDTIEILPMLSVPQLNLQDFDNDDTDETRYRAKARRDGVDVQTIELPGHIDSGTGGGATFAWTFRYRIPLIFDLITGNTEGDHSYDFLQSTWDNTIPPPEDPFLDTTEPAAWAAF